MPGSWIPGTPGKPIPAQSQHAAANGGPENIASGVNRLTPEVGLSPVPPCGGRPIQEGACHVGGSGSVASATQVFDLNSCEAAAASKGSVRASLLSPQVPAMKKPEEGWCHVGDSDLMAVAEDRERSSTGFGSIITKIEQQKSPLQFKFDGGFMPMELLNDVQYRTMAPAFAPVTPDKLRGSQDGQHLGSACSTDGEETARKGQEQASVSRTLDPKGKNPLTQLHFEQGIAEQMCVSSADLPFQLQEKTHEKAEQEVDRNNTPAQNPQRKKHGLVGLSPVPPCRGQAIQEGASQVGGSGLVASATQVFNLNSCEAAATSQVSVRANLLSPQVPAMKKPEEGWHHVGYSDLMAIKADRERDSIKFGSIITKPKQQNSPLQLNFDGGLIPMELLNDVHYSPAIDRTAAPAFAPVTPDKQRVSQNGLHLGSAGSTDGEETAIEGQEQASVSPNLDPKGKDPLTQLHFEQGVAEQMCVMSADLSFQLQEKMQEMAEQGVDLNKTQAQKPRRKKHRPKVVMEGRPAKTPKPFTPTPVNPKPEVAGGSGGGKRKYVRRKGISSPLEPSPNVIGGETTKIPVKRTRSARRRLDFSNKVGEVTCQVTNSIEQIQSISIPERNGGCSTGNNTGYDTKTSTAVNGRQEVGINSSACIALALNHSNNQILDGYLNSLNIPSLPLQPSRRELIRENLKKVARSSGVRQVPNHQSSTRSEIGSCQSTSENASTPNNTSNMLSRDENMRRNEQNMENNVLSDDAQLCRVNAIRTDFSCAHNRNSSKPNGISVSGIDGNHSPRFPEAPKKRRTQKGKNGLAFSEVASLVDAQGILEFARLQYMEGKQACGPTERKRSKTPFQCCNMTLTDNIKSDQLPAGPQNPQLNNEGLNNVSIHDPHAWFKALTADALAKVRRKRRTKQGQTQGFYIPESQTAGSFYRDITPFMQEDKVLDILVQKMKHLNINTDQEENKVKESFAIVPYGAHGMMIPFDGQFDPRKKSRPRAKVDLDQETNRVWKLLMGKESLDGIEGTSVDKEKWWEDERRVLHGRADSFIARMHLVQGDRCFSPWKGSVLDSVIGVFLTQNVSDHLSSSAFMALAARFPHQSRGKCKETNCDKVNTLMGEPMVCTVDLNSSDQPGCVHLQMAVHEARQMEEKGNHPSRNNTQESKSDAVDMLTAKPLSSDSRTSFVELLEIAGSSRFQEFYARSAINSEIESCNLPFGNILKHGWTRREERPSLSSVVPAQFTNLGTRGHLLAEQSSEISSHKKALLTSQSVFSSNSQESMANHDLCLPGTNSTTCYGLQEERTMGMQRKRRSSDLFAKSIQIDSEVLHETKKCTAREEPSGSAYLRGTSDVAACMHMEDKEKYLADKGALVNSKERFCSSSKDPVGEESSAPRIKRTKSEKNKTFDWESLRREACQSGAKNERHSDTMDSLDWEAVRNADVNEIASTIRERGMQNMLAERFMSFLDRLVKDHGSIDLEWLSDIPPDKAKDYLLSIRGLGLKSVECVRLLTLHHLAFPVDTNVGRICVRLGWVPLQPLPESLQLHLLELYAHEVDRWRQLCECLARTATEEREALRREVVELQGLLATQQEVLVRVEAESSEQRMVMVRALEAQRVAEGRLSGLNALAFESSAHIGSVLTGDERVGQLSYRRYEIEEYDHLLCQSYLSRMLPGEPPASPDVDESAPSSSDATGSPVGR